MPNLNDHNSNTRSMRVYFLEVTTLNTALTQTVPLVLTGKVPEQTLLWFEHFVPPKLPVDI